MPIYSNQKAQIKIQDLDEAQYKALNRAQIGAVLFNKTSTTVLGKYFNYSIVFLINKIAKFSEHIEINDYIIKQKEEKQPSFGLVYNLRPIKLKILKTYIKNNLANGFIQLSKSPTSISILFYQKSNSSFCLCMDYQGFNNFIIKNEYPVLLIKKSFN